MCISVDPESASKKSILQEGMTVSPSHPQALVYQEQQSLSACTVQTWRWAPKATIRRGHADLARAAVLEVPQTAIVICPQLEAQRPQSYLLSELQLVGKFRAPSHYQLGMFQALRITTSL